MGLTKASYAMINGAPINVLDYGAVGDGATDSTTAMQNAIDAAITNNQALYIPSGTYVVQDLSYSSASKHCAIFGAGSGTTKLINTINTKPVLTITGSPNQLTVSGITFSGNGTVTSWGTGNGSAGNNLVGTVPTSVCALRTVDLVHSSFNDCYFINAKWGADIRGGIDVTFTNCYAYWNGEVGYRVYQASVAPTSGYPNVVAFRDCAAKENGQAGLYFDQGRDLIIDGGNYEGNGKNTVQAPSIGCGVYIGSLTGIENGATNGPNGTPFHTKSATITNAWFEQNGNNNGAGVPSSTGMAHIILKHGYSFVGQCVFTNTTAGRVVRIDGGQYTVEDCSFESALTVSTNNIDEGGTTGRADIVKNNYINDCYFNSSSLNTKLTATYCTIDPLKTGFDFVSPTGTVSLYGSGTTSGGTYSVTWPAGTWSATPIITAQVYTNNAGTDTFSTEIFGDSTTGFTVRAKQNSGGVVTMPALSVGWIAVGT